MVVDVRGQQIVVGAEPTHERLGPVRPHEPELVVRLALRDHDGEASGRLCGLLVVADLGRTQRGRGQVVDGGVVVADALVQRAPAVTRVRGESGLGQRIRSLGGVAHERERGLELAGGLERGRIGEELAQLEHLRARVGIVGQRPATRERGLVGARRQQRR
jgi:hypothetical protein